MAGKWLVDLDGTLAVWDGWRGPKHIGQPIPAMVERVKAWIAEGREVQIFTARVFPRGIGEGYTDMSHDNYIAAAVTANDAYVQIRDWTEQHFGKRLEVTCWKDYNAVELWDDRSVQVIPNTGLRADAR